MSHPLFVYGTLKAGESHSGLLRGLGRRPATMRGRLYHLPAGYPAMCVDPHAVVHGELVDAPDPRVLSLLDDYEGVSDGLYERIRRTAILGLTSVSAWVWVMRDPVREGGRLLPSGEWSSPWRRR